MIRGNIAAVCYLNTTPFVFGINHASSMLRGNLLLDIPARCFTNLIERKADIGLIPAADLRHLSNDYRLITSLCIGAESTVRTVVLLSNCDLDKIENIYLDSHSHTSAELTKLLANEKWHIKPTYKELTDFNNIDTQSTTDAYLLIGDKVFDFEGVFAHSTDLAEEWIAHTALPFVFAVWVAHKDSPVETIEELERALQYGIENIDQAIESISESPEDKELHRDYLTKNISYNLTEKKLAGLRQFIMKIPPSSLVMDSHKLSI